MNAIDRQTTTEDTKKEQRAEQARINGAKSHGPISPEGKAKSSRNSLKHGFAAKINILIDPDDSDAWDSHLDGYRSSYQPINYAEKDLVDQLASISWRQSRLVGIESALIDFQLSIQEDTVDEYHPLEKGNPRLHIALAWQALARKPYPRLLPADPNEPPDPTQPPDGLDIASIELVRRYLVSLDRQFRNTLLNLRQYRKDFAPRTSAATPQVPEPQPKPAAESGEITAEPNEPAILVISRPNSPAQTAGPPSNSASIVPEVAA